MMKSLKDGAVKIQGKPYILVSDRVLFFNEAYPNGCIKTSLCSKPEDATIVIMATIIPDLKNPERYFTGHAQEVVGEGYINKTSALENAETSAVGRALGLMGIGVLESIASADEIVKSQNRQATTTQQLYGPKKTCPNCKKEHQGRYAKCLDCWREGKDAKPKAKNTSGGIVGAPGASVEEPPMPDEAPF